VIPEIKIWRSANLMVGRYGEAAKPESAKRADELAADGDLAGVAVWLRMSEAAGQLAITTASGPVH
jgi:pyrroloquinoline quinone (PQQ) biosynthesis protein C